MICPKRDCDEGEDCPHYLDHEEITDGYMNGCDCATCDDTCPNCITKLLEFLSEKDMEL